MGMIAISVLNRIDKLKLNPAQVLVLGFAALILIGATLLNLPISSVNGESIGFVDALFTSASAVCVTGLVVVNTAQHWSIFGKVIILILIQVGGLGLMTMATLVALVLGRKITLKERLIIQEELNSTTLSGLVKLTKYVIISTAAIEGIGAIFLAIRFIPKYGVIKGIWFSIFHAISAFCNAGFDLTGESMVPFVEDVVVNLTIIALVIIGGLGYFVYLDISRKKSFRKFSLHTKLVLIISGILLLIGFLFIFILEYNNPETLGKLSFKGKILAAAFQSMTPRTAGFNSIDTGAVTDSVAFLTMIYMLIGGSPGSTAGGVKTTTIGVLVIAIISVIRGNEDVEIYRRRIPHELIYRALAVTGIAVAIITGVTVILSITESGPDVTFLDVLFETLSAFGTVGLSRGLTPKLSILGRLIITFTMFVGRVGPLTMAFAFAKKRREKKGTYRYPKEKILVG
ncbi:TrkH family potassium uptake protein [Caldisalinibacter kiritimatiensis]|uniref:Potassium uptake protein, integral membrane component, KtrB n=1 Tax=Caldisalinibacter kiritimatiensis TaxID=1304284 RepID=R1CWB3_9FIRM|nr:TrkH family potassium uptake protein [Caldisalinibacter kiritimatiensis]EOD00919.1 Potassium uptake protein, integral membrane component, KtrB [Caldisalinibacter kiritimatiensis]